MNQRVLVGGALAAVALGVGVYLLVDRDGGADDGEPRAAGVETGGGGGVAAPERDDPGAPVRARVPTRAKGGADVVEGDGADYVETYEENGGRRRDHRKGDVEPLLRPAGVPHSTKSPVSAAVVDATMRELRPLVIACLAELPDSAFSEDAKVVTGAVISIDEAGSLTARELRPKARGIDEAALEPALECIRGSATAIRSQVDHPAVSEATVSITVQPRRRAQ